MQYTALHINDSSNIRMGGWKRVHARVNANVVEWDRGVEVE